MDALWTTFLNKVLSDCGLFSFAAWLITGIISWQLAKTRKGWEDDRANIEKLRDAEREKYLKMVSDTTALNRDLTVAKEKMEVVLLAINSR